MEENSVFLLPNHVFQPAHFIGEIAQSELSINFVLGAIPKKIQFAHDKVVPEWHHKEQGQIMANKYASLYKVFVNDCFE